MVLEILQNLSEMQIVGELTVLTLLIGGIIIFFCGIFGILSYNNEKKN